MPSSAATSGWVNPNSMRRALTREHQPGQAPYFAFASLTFRGALPVLRGFFASQSSSTATAHSLPQQFFPDCAEQGFIRVGLLQNKFNAGFGHTSLDPRISGSSAHDNRHLAAALAQFGDQFETVDIR